MMRSSRAHANNRRSTEAAVLFEQVGHHVAPAPFVESTLALGALARAGAEGWVERLVGGDAVGCVAWRPDAPVPYAPVSDVAVVLHPDGTSEERAVQFDSSELSPAWQPLH